MVMGLSGQSMAGHDSIFRCGSGAAHASIDSEAD
jgi:hypothetical protein